MTQLSLFIVVLLILMNSIDGQYTVYMCATMATVVYSQSGLDRIALEK